MREDIELTGQTLKRLISYCTAFPRYKRGGNPVKGMSDDEKDNRRW